MKELADLRERVEQPEDAATAKDDLRLKMCVALSRAGDVCSIPLPEMEPIRDRAKSRSRG